MSLTKEQRNAAQALADAVGAGIRKLGVLGMAPVETEIAIAHQEILAFVTGEGDYRAVRDAATTGAAMYDAAIALVVNNCATRIRAA